MVCGSVCGGGTVVEGVVWVEECMGEERYVVRKIWVRVGTGAVGDVEGRWLSRWGKKGEEGATMMG